MLKNLTIESKEGDVVKWKLDGVPGHSLLEDGKATTAVLDAEHFRLTQHSVQIILNAVSNWHEDPDRVALARQTIIDRGLEHDLEVDFDADILEEGTDGFWIACWFYVDNPER